MQASIGRALLESRGGGESVEVDVDDFDGLSPASQRELSTKINDDDAWLAGWGGHSDAEQHRHRQTQQQQSCSARKKA